MTTPQQRAEPYVDLAYRVIFTDDETTDGHPIVVAEHPELPGCMAHGSNREEALQALADARRAYIESLIEDGLTVPLPEPTQTDSGDASETVTARVSAGTPVQRQPTEVVAA